HWRLPAAGTTHAHVVARHALLLLRQARAAPAAEELNALGDNLGDVTFDAVFIIVGTRANTAFDVDLPALGEILPAGLGLFAPNHDVMPFGAFLALAVAVVPLLGSCQRKVGHGAAGAGKAHLGIFSYMTDENNFIDGHAYLRSWDLNTSRAKKLGQLIAAHR